jgi:anti-sigma factor RsiW
MNGHVSDWLSAYYDGELHGPRQKQVEAHLAGCSACRAELEELRKLSNLLQAAPAAERRLSAQRYTSQVMLRLPPAVHRPGWQRALKAGWRLAPLGAVLVWVFGQTVWLITSLVSALSLERTGIPGGWLIPGGASLGWGLAETTLGLGLLNLLFNALVAAFLAGWLASWWVMVRQPSQNHNNYLAVQLHEPG